jgi:hypothetical protein
MNRHSAPTDGAADAAVATADDRQAEYYLRLLSQICRRTNRRISMYERAIDAAHADGDFGYACTFKYLTNIEQRDRKILEGLIDELQRRFTRRDSSEVRPIPRRLRPVVP